MTSNRIHKLTRLGLSVGTLSLISIVLSIGTILSLVAGHRIDTTVVEYKQVVLATDQQRIDLFISELLTPKSAKCFRAILNKESHLNPLAKNPFSDATGVGQLLGSTYSSLGLKKSNDALAQTVATLSYINRHYGGQLATCSAWAYWQIHFNY